MNVEEAIRHIRNYAQICVGLSCADPQILGGDARKDNEEACHYLRSLERNLHDNIPTGRHTVKTSYIVKVDFGCNSDVNRGVKSICTKDGILTLEMDDGSFLSYVLQHIRSYSVKKYMVGED